MSQTKAQLLAPIGVVTAPGLTVTGVTTATSFVGSVTGTASSIVAGSNIIVGVMSATGFAGDFTGTATGIKTSSNLNVGVVTALSFVGDVTGNLTGSAGGLSGTPNVHVGVVTSSAMSGDGSNLTGIAASAFTSQTVPDNKTFSINVTSPAGGNYTLSGTDRNGSVSGSDPTVTVEVGDTLNFVVDASGHPFYIRVSDGGANVSTPAATNQGAQSGTVSWTPNTAGTYYYQCGNHPGMIGTITVSATTTIDLSAGNNILFNQTANTTISFANTSTSEVINILRKDGTGTVTWPSSIRWNNGIEPTLTSSSASNDWNLIKLLTRDSGITWQGWEEAKNEGTFNAFVWGSNWSGDLGQNSVTYYSSPTQLPGITWAKAMRPGGYFHYGTGAIKTDGTLWTWGLDWGGSGARNKGGSFYTSSPAQVGTDTNWASVGSGYKNMGGLKTDGSLWSWGYNLYGFLGQNDITYYSSPVQVPGTYKTRADGFATYAIKTNGQLWTWAGNYKGSFGTNVGSYAVYSSPIQIGTDADWSAVTPLLYGAAAVKTNGTLWTWGSGTDNGNGVLGHNNTANYSSPTQVGSDNTWGKTEETHSSLVAYSVFNIKTNGTLWSWGSNASGSLGHNQHPSSTVGGVDYSSPTQVGSGNDWSKLAATGYAMFAQKTNGSVWFLGGGNSPGVAGINDRVNYSSPVQLPGTDWDVMGNNIMLGGGGTSAMMRKPTN